MKCNVYLFIGYQWQNQDDWGGQGQKKKGTSHTVKQQRAESCDLFIVIWKGTLESTKSRFLH